MCKCVYTLQGFSLFKVVLLCDVTSNTMLFLLKSKGTVIYSIFFSKPKKKKKKLGSLEGLRSLSKSHIFKKWQHQNFCSWSQNWFYATFFSPFFIFGVLVFIDLCRVGWGRCIQADFFLLQDLNSVPIWWFCALCCGAVKKNPSNVGEIREPSNCIQLPSQSHTRTFGACLSPSVSLLLCGSETSLGVWNLNRLEMVNLTETLRGKLLDHMILYYWCCINGEKDLF